MTVGAQILLLLAVLVIAGATTATAFWARGLSSAIDGLRSAVVANTARAADAAEHAEAARVSADKAQASADFAGGYVRELRDAAQRLTAPARKSMTSITTEGPPSGAGASPP